MSPALGSPATARELQVLRALCQPGASYRTTATDLDISVSTVRGHLGRLYARLGVNTAGQAVFALYGRRRRAA